MKAKEITAKGPKKPRPNPSGPGAMDALKRARAKMGLDPETGKAPPKKRGDKAHAEA